MSAATPKEARVKAIDEWLSFIEQTIAEIEQNAADVKHVLTCVASVFETTGEIRIELARLRYEMIP